MNTDHCPHCDAPLAGEAVAKEQCPYCGKRLSGEAIADAVAIKKAEEIPTLKEYVEPPREQSRRSPEHRRNGSGPRCPECGSAYLRSGPWPWYLGTIGAMLCRAMICDDCGHEFDANKPHANLATRKRNLAILINGLGLLGILAVIGGLALWIWWVIIKR